MAGTEMGKQGVGGLWGKKNCCRNASHQFLLKRLDVIVSIERAVCCIYKCFFCFPLQQQSLPESLLSCGVALLSSVKTQDLLILECRSQSLDKCLDAQRKKEY